MMISRVFLFGFLVSFTGVVFAQNPVVSFYVNSNYGGDSVTIYDDNLNQYAQLSGFQGTPLYMTMSSMKIFSLNYVIYCQYPLGIALPTYAFRYANVTNLNQFNENGVSLNDAFVSCYAKQVSVTGGYASANLFENNNYGGQVWYLDGAQNTLLSSAGICDNCISSVQVFACTSFAMFPCSNGACNAISYCNPYCNTNQIRNTGSGVSSEPAMSPNDAAQLAEVMEAC